MACAAIPQAESIAVAVKVVHQEKDSWIDYAFRQAVRHLEAKWRPAFEQGDLQFEDAIETAAVLAETGGGVLVDSLKDSFNSPELKGRARLEVLANILTAGGEREVYDYALRVETFDINGLYHPILQGKALRVLAANAKYRDVRPAGDWQPSLIELTRSQHVQVRAGAILLAGAWDVDACKPVIYEAAADADEVDEVRVAAFQSLSLLEKGGGREGLIELLEKELSLTLTLEVVDALALLDSGKAIEVAAEMIGQHDLSDNNLQQLLSGVLQHRDSSEQLAGELQNIELSQQRFQQILSALLATGRADQKLLAVLGARVGISTQPPAYSESFITSLKQAALESGDPMKGAAVFKAVACASCHRIKGQGGAIGPDLTGLGTTLSGERIIEELIWPNRQVKEGYTSLRVITRDGKVLQGYQRKTKLSESSGGLALLDPQTQRILVLDPEDIDEVQKSASVMPEGLTNLLKDQQLYDLIAFLMKRETD